MKVYLDNAATSWPKPISVPQNISDYLINNGCNPGKSYHSEALEAGRLVFETRELIAELFEVDNSENVIFTNNATHSLNIVLHGLVKQNDHVIISSMEHNSVWRPLNYLKDKKNVSISTIPVSKEGHMDAGLLEKCINPKTKAVVIIHGSNVNGNILPIEKIGEICRKRNIYFIVDASQTAGLFPISKKEQFIDALVFSGHKYLYGPSGIGVLCLKKSLNISPFMQGGSGNSQLDEMPLTYPDRLEAGTINTTGIIGLKAGLEFIQSKGIFAIRNTINTLSQKCISGLININELVLFIPSFSNDFCPVISFNIKGHSPSDIGYWLDTEYNILTRTGLHCAPLAHKTIGTFPEGTVRISPGFFNTFEDIDYFINSLKEVLFKHKNSKKFLVN